MTPREGGTAGVLAIGPLPPPVHGYSLITAQIIERLRRVTAVEVLDLSPGTMARGWRYHVTRVGRALRALSRLVRQRAQGRTLYLAIAGGAGVLYDVGFVLAARWRGYRIVIHHNAFSYLNRRSWWTAQLVAIAGSDALHLCLCPTMARRLGEQYPRAERRTVLSNAALVPPASIARRPAAPTGIRLGFLSNLIPEKGLDTAIAVAATLRTRGAAATLVIAGPVLDRSAGRILEEAKKRLGPALDYRGAVHGTAKETFFGDIDVLLFPTRYANEAQPLVLIEALAHGVPVIATARGCIGEDIGGAGIAVPLDGDFVEIAAAAISSWLADPSRLALVAAAARRHAAELHHASASALDCMISMIAGMTTPPGSTDDRNG